MDKILQLFLNLKNIRIRNTLAVGLKDSLKGNILKSDVLEVIVNLNKLKRGAADLELDYDLIIKTIESLMSNDLSTWNRLELQGVSYSILYLISSEEFSVRDYAAHFVKNVLLDNKLRENNYTQMIQLIEQMIKENLSKVKDEMILKTVLDITRHYINFAKN